jgi:hypothetical protein
LRLVKYIYDIAASDAAGWDRAISVSGAGSPGARRVAAARGFDIEGCVKSVLAQISAATPSSSTTSSAPVPAATSLSAAA